MGLAFLMGLTILMAPTVLLGLAFLMTDSLRGTGVLNETGSLNGILRYWYQYQYKDFNLDSTIKPVISNKSSGSGSAHH